MAKQGIGTGNAPNDGLGDSLLVGAIKINSNFNEIYSAIGDGTNITNRIGYASTSGISTYSTRSGIATYATTAGIATYATTAGIATYATTAGIATYSTSSGIATYATRSGIATYASTAGIATYSTSSGIATYASTAGIATLSSGLSGSPNITVGIITASFFVGDGSLLTNLPSTGGTSSQWSSYSLGISTTSNVGIGTTNPTSTLTVFGNTNITGIATASTLNDSIGNVRRIPQNSVGIAYTLTVSDAGKHIAITTGGITIPTSIFAVGDNLTIFNNSDYNQMITPASGVTLRRAGIGDTGARGLNGYGLATILCINTNSFIITGAGLT